MTEPLQTPPDGTQQPAQVTPQEDLNETETALAQAQQRIEDEAKELEEQGTTPEPPQDPPLSLKNHRSLKLRQRRRPRLKHLITRRNFWQSAREAQNLIAKNNEARLESTN